MRKILFTALFALLACVFLRAQDETPSTFHRLEIESAFQQFVTTNNAAGMGLFQPSRGSNTSLEGFGSAGDRHLAQQGDGTLGFEFSTLRYDSFSDKLFMRGSFCYHFDREKNRPWSDVLDPWFSIPFIYGSSIAKDYDTHDCALSFDLYTAPLSDIVSLGVRANYEVADVSGLRDPRPRTGYLNYSITPSVLFKLGRHSLGLDIGYGYSKEKLTGLTTIQSYPNLYYYKMSGLDHVDGAIAAYSGFKRQFYGSRFLGDLSWAYNTGGLRAMATAGLEYGRLDAYGDKMQSPGSYNYFKYSAQADVLVTEGTRLHRIHIGGAFKDAGADEYLQELTSTKDPVTGATTELWETLYVYTNRYMLKTLDVSADYVLYGGYSGPDYLWSLRARCDFTGFDKQCWLPYSGFAASSLGVSLGGSAMLLRKGGHRLELALGGEYRLALGDTMELQYDGDYVREVLLKDFEYYGRNAFSVNGSLTWEFPLSLGKAGKANGYVRLSGSTLRDGAGASRSGASLALGLFTF